MLSIYSIFWINHCDALDDALIKYASDLHGIGPSPNVAPLALSPGGGVYLNVTGIFTGDLKE